MSGPVIAADFNDPMRPPPYALNKFRLEKLQLNKPQNQSKKIKQQKQSPWVLSSILFSRQRQHAIINNQLVKKGETIKGAKLIRLKPGSVRLLVNGKVIDLSLRKQLKTVKKSLSEKKS
jgi:hypothetical protein